MPSVRPRTEPGALELEVIPSGVHQRSDSEIALAVEHALSWNTSVPQGRVKVTVEKGWVTLKGDLDWNFQRRAVERIQEALTRQAMREARRIEVSVEGSEVTLRGHVHSWAEKKAAEGATWSAPGVSRVNNQLTVDV
jgi:osmotically-inducible protein OsmY